MRKGKISPVSLHSLNAEFQRIARREKPLLNEQYKETEEINRMGKPRVLLKKIGDTKEIFHGRMGTKKDKNGKDLFGKDRSSRD